jgi:hypothetical protein
MDGGVRKRTIAPALGSRAVETLPAMNEDLTQATGTAGRLFAGQIPTTATPSLAHTPRRRTPRFRFRSSSLRFLLAAQEQMGQASRSW